MRKLLPWLLMAVSLTGCGGEKDQEGGSGVPEEVSGAFNTAPSEFTYDLESPDVPGLASNTFLDITEGESEISGGRSNYKIRIELPPAVNNLAPDLFLNYNSGNTRSGHLGVGWSIGGLSSIYRCPANYAVDGEEAKKSNPQYTHGDRLCMDGQRLVVSDIRAMRQMQNIGHLASPTARSARASPK